MISTLFRKLLSPECRGQSQVGLLFASTPSSWIQSDSIVHKTSNQNHVGAHRMRKWWTTNTISPTGLKQELEILTLCSSLAQELHSFIDGLYLWGYLRDYSKRKRNVLWSNNMNVGVLVLICGETKRLTKVCALPALFQLTLAMHLTSLPFLIPRCGRNTSKMPRQMCACPAGVLVSIWTVCFSVGSFLLLPSSGCDVA